MDQQHHAMNDEHAQPYPFYPQDQDSSPYIPYNPQMAPYQAVPHSVPPHLQQPGMQQFHTMGMMPGHQFQPSVYPPSPPHVPLPVPSSPTPPSPDMYADPLSPPISGSDTSAEGGYHSGANSPTSTRNTSLVHRHVRSYNPTPSPTSSSGRRSRGRSHDSEEDEMGGPIPHNFAETLANTRKEATRRQRIEAEQRRRDELRDGYAKLKDVLPVSNQKSSKVSLLDRATNHITALEKLTKELQERLATAEAELQRLRSLNEKISLNAGETPSPGMFDARPLSPPPDIPHTGSKSSAAPQSDDSGLSEDGDF